MIWLNMWLQRLLFVQCRGLFKRISLETAGQITGRADAFKWETISTWVKVAAMEMGRRECTWMSKGNTIIRI